MFGVFNKNNMARVTGGSDENAVCKQSLLQAIKAVRAGKTAYLKDASLGCEEVSREWNEMLASICADKRAAVLGVNNLLAEVTKMDFIKSMIEDVRKQSQTMNSIAASQEIAADVNVVSAGAEGLLRECDQTGKAVFELSQATNVLRTNLMKNELCLGDAELLDICIADHLMWRWRVYNMLLGYEQIDVNAVGTHRDCRLGDWYYSEAAQGLKGNRVFIEMDKPHADLHRFAKEAAIAYARKDLHAAQTALDRMDVCSREVVEALHVLKKHVVALAS